MIQVRVFAFGAALMSFIPSCHERRTSGQPASSGAPPGQTSAGVASSAPNPKASGGAAIAPRPPSIDEQVEWIFDPRHVLPKYEGPPVAYGINGCFVLKSGETRCLTSTVPVAHLRPPAGGIFYDDPADNGCFADPAGTIWCWGKVRAHVVRGTNTCAWKPWPPNPEGEEYSCPAVNGFYYCAFDQICEKPAQLARLSNVKQLVGREQRCALLKNGEVWCWGENSQFEGPGPGRCKMRPEVHRYAAADVCFDPERVRDIPPMQSIAVGSSVTCALTGDGRLFCWGDLPPTYSRQPGRGADQAGSGPTKQKGWPKLKQVTVAWPFLCGLTLDDRVFCQNNVDPAPRHIEGFGDALELGGDYLICARNRAREVWCAVNPRSNAPLPSPRRIPGISTATQLVASAIATCAVLEDASAYCWGNWRYRGEHRSWPPMPALP
jgi:hypothetical protein